MALMRNGKPGCRDLLSLSSVLILRRFKETMV